MKKITFLLCILIVHYKLMGQYTENGNAAATNCHCYILTPDQLNKTGSVWNNNKIDLRASFNFQFNVFLGCADATGADGIVFALQPISTSVGSAGGGMGFEGITPSVGVTLDTWQNTEYNDPAYDHIDIQYNGNITHTGAAPPPISATSDNVEDCQWHTLSIKWDAATTTYSAYFDGVLRISTVNDLVKNVFNGNPLVYWGFTGSTGGASNLQQFCTALNPAFRLLPDQKRCIGELVQFYDSTISFAPLFKRYWDFGDGTPIDSVDINPVHVFTAAGDYNVVQTVVGIDGCSETNKQLLRIGSKPISAFAMNNACADSLVKFIDASSEQVGTINQWNWDLNFGASSTLQNPVQSYPFYSGTGPFAVKLSVKTLEGCVSDTATNYLKIFPRPTAYFINPPQACSNTPVIFTDSSYLDPSGNTLNAAINNWAWNFGNGQVSSTQNSTISFATAGNNSVSLIVKTDSGCSSLPFIKPVYILAKPIAYFTNNNICQDAVITFTDSSYSAGNGIKAWWWNLGNGTVSSTKDPTTTYTIAGDVTVQLAVSDSNQCISDTLKKVITVGSKPVAKFGNSLPLCENTSIQFSDSSVTATGNITNWLWHFDNGDSSTLQNSSTTFSAADHLVQLVVTNAAGCSSDIIEKKIFVNAAPAVGFTFASSCKNAIVDFNGISNSGNIVDQWRWGFGDGATATEKNAQHIYVSTGTYAVTLLATSPAGCVSTKDSSIIIYGTSVFAGNDTVAAPGQPIQLQASGGLSYQWSPASGLDNPNISNPVATNTTNQTYYLKASTPIGCETFDTVSIKIYKGPQLYLPNAFTPNGDSRNDVFRIFPVGIAHLDYFTIYDRYGKMVFFTKDLGQGWDGTLRGQPQDAGVYVWMVSGTAYTGNKIINKGTVVLIK